MTWHVIKNRILLRDNVRKSGVVCQGSPYLCCPASILSNAGCESNSEVSHRSYDHE